MNQTKPLIKASVFEKPLDEPFNVSMTCPMDISQLDATMQSVHDTTVIQSIPFASSSTSCSHAAEALHGKIIVTTAAVSKPVDPSSFKPVSSEYVLKTPKLLPLKKSSNRPDPEVTPSGDLNTAFLAGDRQPFPTSIELDLETPVNRPPPSLDTVLHKARQELSRRNVLDSPVGSVGLRLSVRPPDSRASIPVDHNTSEDVTPERMEGLLNQIDSITVTLQQQREIIARHEKSMSSYQSQLRQKDLEIEQMRRSTTSGSRAGARRTLSEVAAEYQQLLQAEGKEQPDARKPSQPTEPSVSEAAASRPHTGQERPDDRVQAALGRLHQELRLQREEIRRLSNHQANLEQNQTGSQHASSRSRVSSAAEDVSRRMRSIISGATKEEVSKSYPATNEPSMLEDLATIESKLEEYLEEEEKLKASNPEPGQGFYYLQGDPPFWRRPWPAEWRVPAPWEFDKLYNHRDLQKQLHKLPLDKFEGQTNMYRQWQRTFYKMVHVQDMDDDIKLNFLSRNVSLEVKERIMDSLSCTQTDYCMAVARLEQIYGVDSRRPERQSERLTACKPFLKHELRKATDFLHKLQGYVGSALERGVPSAGVDLMPVLKRIVPSDWLEGYVLWVQNTKTVENPETLYAYLKPIVDTKIELQPYTASTTPSGRKLTPARYRKSPSNSPNGAAALVGATNGSSTSCPACSDDHALKKCPHFYHRLTNVERRQLLEQRGLCLICFTDTHLTSDCYNKRRCALCADRHNVWVHVPDDDIKAQGGSYRQQQSESTSPDPRKSELSGVFVGAGFMAHQEGEEDFNDDGLRYAFVGSAAKPSPSPRRSPRIAAKRNPVTPTNAKNESQRRDSRSDVSNPRQQVGARTGRPWSGNRGKVKQRPKRVTFEDKRPFSKKNDQSLNHEVVPDLKGKEIEVGLAQTVLNLQNPISREHMNVNVLIDSGANHTAISKRVADKLGLKGLSSPYKVVTFGGDCFRQESALVQITLRSLNGKRSRTFVVRSVPELCGSLKAFPWNQLKKQWSHTRGLDFVDPVGDSRIDLLIGTENADFAASVLPDIVGTRAQDPVIRQTAIGLIPMGFTKPWREDVKGRFNFAQACAIVGHASVSDPSKQRDQELLKLESKLYQDLQLIFSVEHALEEKILRNTKEKKCLSIEQAKAAESVHQSLQYHAKQRCYEASIPWLSAERPSNNLWEALKIFRSYRSRNRTQSEQTKKMIQTINEWLELGYAHVVDGKESRRRDSFVIPSFIVTRTDKTSTQHRLVINAAKEFKGRSINDYISRTPDAMNELYSVLLKFRLGRHAFTADIKHMFLRILTNKNDQKYLRVLHQPKDGGPIQVVQCSRHVFGLRSSPYIAMEVIRHHARLHCQKWPLATMAVLHCSIVDDILVSADSEEELIRLHDQLRRFFADMSMVIHKCAASSVKVMAQIPPVERAKQVPLDHVSSSNPDLLPVIKTLGLVYRPEDDRFYYEYRHEFEGRWTLRKMVSAVARLFDPLGLVSPFLMAGRSIIQLIWASGRKWDQNVDIATQNKCDLWLRKAKELSLVQVPRMVVPKDAKSARLVVFSDACKIGYAAALYVVHADHSALVASKTRVAPTKKDESIQRLELAGCQLAVDTAVDVCHAMGFRIGDVQFFTDSITALSWLRTTGRMSVFVGNRVCKIKDRTDVSQWKHVPGRLNPADLASRGAKPSTIANSKIWLQGPPFLVTGEIPEQPELTDTIAVKQELVDYEEQLKKVNLFFLAYSLDEATEFELNYVKSRRSLRRGLRVLSVVYAAVHRLTKKIFRLRSLEEVSERVLRTLVVEHQKQFWAEEMSLAVSGTKTSKQLKTLCPFIDQDCVLKVESRLRTCWWLPESTRKPILLKPSGYLAKALLHDIHALDLQHSGGPEQLLHESRAQYWITQARGLCKEVIRGCQRCRVKSLKPYRPPMSGIHPSRLGSGEPLQAFKQVGIDMAGPFFTKGPPATRSRSKGDYKRYLLIIACSVTRAVSLELMMSAESDSCAMALERFSSVYGVPTTINSDCGSNLLGVRSEAIRREQWLADCKKQLPSHYQTINWRPNPPYSANWGGHFEKLIGVAKKAMSKVLDNNVRVLNDEELLTLFKKVQDLMNRRPLVHVPSTDESYLALTPNDLLKTGNKTSTWILPSDEAGAGILKRHKKIEAVIDQYWEIFKKIYIPTLHRTEKWTSGSPGVVKGDIVAVLYPETPRGRWPLGRVVEVFPGKDGFVRSVEVETHVGGKRTRLRRSASGLMVIPPETQS